MSGVRPDPVDVLLHSLNIYSPTGQEGRLAAYLCAQMKKLGYSDVRKDSAGNALGEVGSGKKRLLLCGHMDTVPGRLEVTRRGDFISGRGAADAKSPLCALLMAGSECASAGLRVTFAGVTREEGDSLGIETLIKEAGRFDYAVFGEPGGAGKITVGYRGRLAAAVRFSTEGGHAGSPWAHHNAIDSFCTVLAGLKEYEASNAREGGHFYSISVTPTLLAAGTYHNVVPSSCDATFDVRIPPGKSSKGVRAELRSLIVESAAPSRVTVQFGEATEPYVSPPGSAIVRAFQRAILLSLRSLPKITRKTGTGDMNTFATATKAECVTYGPGDSSMSHTCAASGC